MLNGFKVFHKVIIWPFFDQDYWQFLVKTLNIFGLNELNQDCWIIIEPLTFKTCHDQGRDLIEGQSQNGKNQ
jgi:hypothetical protein